MRDKKVFLHERKRHTTRHVASARSAALFGGRGVPPSSPDEGALGVSTPSCPDGVGGTPSSPNREYPHLVMTGYPPPCWLDGDTPCQPVGGYPLSGLDGGTPRVWTDT